MTDAPHDAPTPDAADGSDRPAASRRRPKQPRPESAPATEAQAPAATPEAAPRRRRPRAAAPAEAEARADEAGAAPTPSDPPAAEDAPPRRRAAPRARPAPAEAAAPSGPGAPDPDAGPASAHPAEAAEVAPAPAEAEPAPPAEAAAADDRAAPPEGGDAAAPRRPAQVPPPPESLVAARALFNDLVEGAFDPEAATSAVPAAEADAPEAEDASPEADAPARRVLEAEADAPKLHKVLAQSGVGSRRDMEQWIADGKVTVNGELAHLGMRVVVGDRVEVDGKPIRLRIHPPSARVLAYHKPTGEVVTHQDPEGRPTVFRHLPRLPQGKWLSVGRLDINTEGLLLFTNSGDLANRLMHPRFGVEREYAVRVLGQLDEAQRAQLLAGVEIDGLPAAFRSIEDGGGEGANRWFRVVIAEGRNREVRKLFESVGLAVSRLIRIRYGSVVLPRGLRRGVWVELDEPDLKVIRRLAGLVEGPRPAPPGKGAKPPRGAKPVAPARAAEGRPPKGPKPSAAPPRPVGKPARPPRAERPPREALRDAEGELLIDDIGRIPNPLEQTFDRRFAKGGPRRPAQGFGGARPEGEEGFPSGGIPNPLEQTFDRRFVKGSQRIVAGFGRPDTEDTPRPAAKGKGPKQPDPMQTSVGYIGADAYFNKGKKGGGGGWGGKRHGR